MAWLNQTLIWYGYIFILGIIFLPLTAHIFKKHFFDFGYPFTKIIAIVSLSFTTFLLGILRILPFQKTSLLIIIIISLYLNYQLLIKTNLLKQISDKIYFFILEELTFIFAFISWVIVRGQAPAIRGLEKFMDFGFINSILRTKFFPPLDIWYSATSSHPQGFFINYYYFGHLIGAFLIKLTAIASSSGYNLILATIFGLGVTETFSLVANLVYTFLKDKKKEISFKTIFLTGFLGSFIVNLGGNLHPIYVFTKGYPNNSPRPFWQILSKFNPAAYWYPNATRFIPFTIHEFPIYSYVVADLHGHVFDIPIVLLTLSFLFILTREIFPATGKQKNRSHYLLAGVLGFLTAIHYMVNAFDAPIYLLLTIIIFFAFYRLSVKFLKHITILIVSFVIFSLPFSINFKPFASGIGLNCSPNFLIAIHKLGPFVFEAGKCQSSPLWMLFILWGFFWINAIIFTFLQTKHHNKKIKIHTINDYLVSILFAYGTFLIIIPEFFYAKDIYPGYFRANTMFKLGYQAFIMMGIASAYTYFRITQITAKKTYWILKFTFIFFFFFTAIYPYFAIKSFYGNLSKPVKLNGINWLKSDYPADKEIVDYLNKNVSGQPTILEAQGDSYTDYERISAYTGLPTVAGWQVHEWLWRGSAQVVGKRIPDIIKIYQSEDLDLTKKLIKKYRIDYIIVSDLERKKYPKLDQDKFSKIGHLIFKSTNGKGLVFKTSQSTY